MATRLQFNLRRRRERANGVVHLQPERQDLATVVRTLPSERFTDPSTPAEMREMTWGLWRGDDGWYLTGPEYDNGTPLLALTFVEACEEMREIIRWVETVRALPETEEVQ